MELVLVGIIVWLWLRLRQEVAARQRRDRVDESAGGPVAGEGLVVCEVGGHLYWLRSGALVRARHVNGLAEIGSAVPVDPLLCDDVSPATLVEILDALERAGRTREHDAVLPESGPGPD